MWRETMSKKLENQPKESVCRIPLPDGGEYIIRTSGNIQPGEGKDLIIAETNYPLEPFVENYDEYFLKPKITKPDPASGEE